MTSSPLVSVAPMTWPVWMPPPDQRLVKARGQWSRPGWTVPEGALAALIEGAFEGIEFLPQRDLAIETADFSGVRQPDVGDGELRLAGIAGDDEGRPGVAEIGGAVVLERRVDADVGRQGAFARTILRAHVVGDGHPVGIARLGFVARVGVAGEELHRAGGMAAGRLDHRAQHGEPVRDGGLPGQ